jgi:hypothetical protein
MDMVNEKVWGDSQKIIRLLVEKEHHFGKRRLLFRNPV